MEGTLAEIRMFAGNFNPRGWFYCNGSLQSIAQNTALFSLVGTTYGGDGQTTFALPDFRGRVAVGAQFSQGPGLPPVQLGEMSGFPSTTLLTNNLPVHNHTIAGNITPKAANNGALTTDPEGRRTGAGSFYTGANDLVNEATIASTGLTLAVAGSSVPVSVMQPYLGMNYIICSEGIYPSRN
jgi:microcystin-dependent protein